MYLLEKRIKLIKIKNVVFAVIAIFALMFSVSFEVYLIVRYWGDLFTIMHAKATPDFIFWIIVGPLMLINAARSRADIGDANFYSGYFEGDLDGRVSIEELSDVTGKSKSQVTKQLRRFTRLYMKNYTIDKDGDYVDLASKTAECECRSCGAHIEKKLYFTGVCSYCGSSDLRAKVLTDGRFYSISNELGSGGKSADYYTVKNLDTRKIMFPILMGLSMAVIAILFMMSADTLSKYNDKEYLRSIILDPTKHMQSYELIHNDMKNDLITNAFIIIGLIPVLINRIMRISYVGMADVCSKFFAKYKTPCVKASDLPNYQNKNNDRKIQLVRQAMKKRYLKNCTLERHSGVLEVALAKRIVKDQCPSCGASITGAVDKDYTCSYCGRRIMNVVVKK